MKVGIIGAGGYAGGELLRLLSGHPVMIERGVYPDRVGVLVAGMDLAADSITERLEELGVVFADAEHVIDAVPALSLIHI